MYIIALNLNEDIIMVDTVQRYVIDAVLESNEGRKDYQELLNRVEVTGRFKAVEMRDEIDYFFTRVKGRDDVTVFMYKEGSAPDLAIGKVIEVK